MTEVNTLVIKMLETERLRMNLSVPFMPAIDGKCADRCLADICQRINN